MTSVRMRCPWIRRSGFYTGPDFLDKHRANLTTYLEQGCHGDMAWMRETQERRGDPGVLWPDAVSVISVGMNYAPGENVLQALKNGTGTLVFMRAIVIITMLTGRTATPGWLMQPNL